MMQTIADLAIILGQTPELSLVVKMTIAAALGLAVVRLSRAARASVRHLVLTSTFAALLALPVAMLIAPAVAIELPWARAIANDASGAALTAGAAQAGGGAGARSGAADAARRAGGMRAAGNDGTNARAAGAQSGSGFIVWLTAVGRATGLLATANGDGVRAAGVGVAGATAGSDASGAMVSVAATPWFARVPWLAMMRVVWLVGAATLLGMLAIQLVRLRAVRRTGLPWMERRTEAMRMAREAGVNRPVTVMLHEGVPAPLTCGWRNPVILFPADARSWSDGDIRRVLLHELEHVRRGDWVVQLAARATCAIYWFHPLVWTAWRQLCLEAERACDDAVVRSEAGTDYAEQLVELARRMSRASAHPMVAMASRGDLSTRVTALLDRRQRRGRAGMMTFVAAVSAAAFLVITIAPLRAVAAVADIDQQAASARTSDGRGTGSGAGVGSGMGSGSGAGRGASASAGVGAGAGAGSDAAAGAAAGADMGAAVGAGVPGGAAGGVIAGVPGGVVGGVAGGVTGQPVTRTRDQQEVERISEDQSTRLDETIKTKEQTVVYEKRSEKLRESRLDRAKGEALIEAADDGDINGLKELLAAGIDVNTKVYGDGSALIAASRKGEIAAVKFLIERGADVNMPVRGDGSPLIAAAAHGHPDVVTLLLDQGADMEMMVDGDENALIQAAGRGYLDVVKLLVARGANVNASITVAVLFNGNPQTESRTPLSMARRGGHADVVAFLQSAGAVQ